MFPLLLIALFLLQVTASSVSKTVPGVVNNDQCVCNVVVPDNVFPVERLESMEDTARRLNTSILQEINRLKEYENRMKTINEKLDNLMWKVNELKIPTGEPLSSNVSFELLKAEVKEMEVFVQALQSSINGSDSNVDNLYNEVQNISSTVTQLEDFDKTNVLSARREIDILKKRLQNCTRNSSYMSGGVRKYGICDHKGIARIGKPTLVQLNWRGFAHKQGAWGKDSVMNSSMKNQYWVAPLETNGRLLDTVYVYKTYIDLEMYRNPIEKQLSTKKLNHTNSGQGGGMIMHNNNLYYNCYDSRDICKFNLETNKVMRKVLPNAVYNNRFSYAGVSFQDIDFESDEKGLWVLYTTDKNLGKMIIGRLNGTSLGVDKVWVTSQNKPKVTSAFMVCGVLYATRSVSARKEEIFYMYDTNTGKEGKVSIMVEKITESLGSVHYNPNNGKLYSYTEGYEMVYDVSFKY